MEASFKYTRHGTYNCGQDYIFSAQFDRIVKRKNKEKLKKWLNINKIEEFLKKVQNSWNHSVCTILPLFKQN